MQGEIAFSELASSLDLISKRNRWRPTRLEIFGELGAQEAEKGLPLVGITLNENPEEGRSVVVLLGDHDAMDPRHLTHTINHVRRVMLKQADDGRDEALEIEDEQGEKNLLHFEPTPRVSAIR
jgi:hypothetical protein